MYPIGEESCCADEVPCCAKGKQVIYLLELVDVI